MCAFVSTFVGHNDENSICIYVKSVRCSGRVGVRHVCVQPCLCFHVCMRENEGVSEEISTLTESHVHIMKLLCILVSCTCNVLCQTWCKPVQTEMDA